MNPETLYKNRLMPKLKAIPNSYWIKTQMVSLSGVPDILGCVNGRFVALELKASWREARKKHYLQKHVIKRIRQTGGYAEFIYPENEELIIEEIKEFSK